MITAKRLREVLRYNRRTGVFTWRTMSGLAGNGKRRRVAGSVRKNGYREITVDGRCYQASNLAWLYVYGRWPRMVDHKNRKPDDNRIANLRLATRRQNKANSKTRSDSASGLKGAAQLPNGRWRARIMAIHLGYFATAEEAHAAYRRAARKHFGEFAFKGATDVQTKTRNDPHPQ
jgi:hypothetical protein